MSQENVYTIDELRQIVVPLLDKYGMQEARLFGSYARGAADASSDIDLLLTGKPGFRPLAVYGLSADVMKATGRRYE